MFILPEDTSRWGLAFMMVVLGVVFGAITLFFWYDLRPGPEDTAEHSIIRLLGLLAAACWVGAFFAIESARREGEDEPERVPFFRQAARASCLTPVIIAGTRFVWERPIEIHESTPQVASVVLVVISGLGLAFGIAALSSSYQRGPRSILLQSLLGILLNGFVILGVFLAPESLRNLLWGF